MQRRNFLAQGVSGLALMKTALASGAALAGDKSSADAWPKSGQKPVTLPAKLGTYYERDVPDTLDLAERARIGLHHFTNGTYEEHGYEMPLTVDLAPPAINFHMNSLGACQGKAMEAMAELRIASGSQEGIVREAKMVEMMASGLGEDGLYWVPGGRADKPWIAIKEPFAMVFAQGSMMGAMIAWYQYTGDPAWKERIDRLVNALDGTVVS